MLPKDLAAGSKAERFFKIEKREAINVEARTVELAFSSEEPYQRWWGVEILDHSKTSVDMSRMTDGAPLLVGHDTDDHVGVIESARIDADRVGRAIVRFGKSARAEEIFQDVVDGIRTKISVGYRILDAVLESQKDGVDTYRVTKWEPYECSFVSVPADATVGVGRSTEAPAAAPEIKPQSPSIQIKGSKMDDTQAREQEALRALGADAEHKRVSEISNTAHAYAKYDLGDLAREAITSKMSVEEFKQRAMEKMAAAPKPTAEIGLSAKEVKQYSIVRAINAMANPNDIRAQQAAGFERECGVAVGQIFDRQAQGMFIPFDVLNAKRDLTAGGATTGAALVPTNLHAQSFIDMLRNKMVLGGLGMQYLDGLVGNVDIPRQYGAATTYWVGEQVAPTDSNQLIDKVSLSAKTVGARTIISRKLRQQASYGVEQMVTNDLSTSLALALETAFINGSGATDNIRGLLNIVGIGSVAGGVDGSAPDWDDIVDLETAVSVLNADVGSLHYLTNAKVRGKLKKTFVDAGSGERVWDKGAMPLNGYNAAVTNLVPSNGAKGSGTGLSSILFGNFSDCIVGFWGGLDLLVDPYTGGAEGDVAVRVLQDADMVLRHVESFAAKKDAITV